MAKKLMVFDSETGSLSPADGAVTPTPKWEMVVMAGDAGVYVGWVRGGISALTSERVIEGFGRFLRHYYVAGRTGDGSALDLACRGIDRKGSSISDAGWFRIACVYRVFAVPPNAQESFDVPKPGDDNDAR